MSRAPGSKRGSAFVPRCGNRYEGAITIDGRRVIAIIEQEADGARLTIHDIVPPVSKPSLDNGE